MALVATSRFAAALAENNVQNPPTSCSDCQRGLGSISYAVQEWAKCKCQTPSFCPTCAAKPSARAIFPTRSPALLEHEPWIKLLNDDASDALFPRAAAAPEPKAPTRNEALASAEEADRREAGDQLDGAISVIRLVDYIDDLCGDDHPRNAFSPEHGSIKFVIDKLGELLQNVVSMFGGLDGPAAFKKIHAWGTAMKPESGSLTPTRLRKLGRKVFIWAALHELARPINEKTDQTGRNGSANKDETKKYLSFNPGLRVFCGPPRTHLVKALLAGIPGGWTLCGGRGMPNGLYRTALILVRFDPEPELGTHLHIDYAGAANYYGALGRGAYSRWGWIRADDAVAAQLVLEPWLNACAGVPTVEAITAFLEGHGITYLEKQQKNGDLVEVPTGWAHIVINVGQSFKFAQEVTRPAEAACEEEVASIQAGMMLAGVVTAPDYMLCVDRAMNVLDAANKLNDADRCVLAAKICADLASMPRASD